MTQTPAGLPQPEPTEADQPPTVATRLSSLERVMGVLDERVEDGQLSSAREVTRQITERLSLSPAHTVVALAGATGSGKSSLFNALAGLDLSEVGVRRPVTNAPHACVWGPDGAGPLLDWLSIPYENRTARESALDAQAQSELRGLVLLDLPDHDSTQLAHRLEVDRLVELVDLLIWVLDPQKYADEAVHARYLRRLSRHSGVTLILLNQVDQLSRADTEACLADMRRLLDADGLRGVAMMPLSALRGDGMPELKERIAHAVATRQAAVTRLAADLDVVADELAPLAGPEVREDVDRNTAKRLYTSLADAAGSSAVGEAVERGYRFSAAKSLGWPAVRWFQRAKDDPLAALRGGGKPRRGRRRNTARPAVLHPVQRPQVEEALRTLADDTTEALPAPWPRLVHKAARTEIDQLPDALDRAVAAADLGLARRPAWWRAVQAVQYLLVACLGVGLVWALGLALAAAVSDVETGGLVFPVALLLVGLVLGPVLHLVGTILAARGARLARLRAEQAVLDAVTTVARERVLAAVRSELNSYNRVRDALVAFGVAMPSEPAAGLQPAERIATTPVAEPEEPQLTGLPEIPVTGALPPAPTLPPALPGLPPMPTTVDLRPAARDGALPPTPSALPPSAQPPSAPPPALSPSVLPPAPPAGLPPGLPPSGPPAPDLPPPGPPSSSALPSPSFPPPPPFPPARTPRGLTPPAPPPRAGAAESTDDVWARSRPPLPTRSSTGRGPSPDGATGIGPEPTPPDTDTPSTADQPQAKPSTPSSPLARLGRRERWLAGPRTDSPDTVERWWANTDDSDPFAKP